MPAEATVPSIIANVAPAMLLAAMTARHVVFAALMLALLAVGIAALLTARPAVSQTTQTSAWWWAIVALAAWWAVALATPFVGAKAGQPWLAPLRLAAVSLSFCPVVSLMGAKRPQHVAWNFVVLSLWAITALPAAEAFFLQRGGQPEMGAARGWFLWILIALGPINFVATRFWLPSLVFALAQILALAPYLALIRHPIQAAGASWIGWVLAVVAIGFAWRIAHGEVPVASPYDRLWLDFRDRFGMFWALRVQERVNAAARQYDWDLELAWSGFVRRADGKPLESMTLLSPAVPAALAMEGTLRTTFQGLLRRFVSKEWIAQRLSETPALPSSSPSNSEAD